MVRAANFFSYAQQPYSSGKATLPLSVHLQTFPAVMPCLLNRFETDFGDPGEGLAGESHRTDGKAASGQSRRFGRTSAASDLSR